MDTPSLYPSKFSIQVKRMEIMYETTLVNIERGIIIGFQSFELETPEVT